MTSQNKDKFICEKLDVVWHERIKDSNPPVCTCGVSTYYNVDFGHHLKGKNPSFVSEAGRVQLLKLMTDKDDFWYQEEQYLDLEDFMLDDDGKFRDAVFKWLGGIEDDQKKKKKSAFEIDYYKGCNTHSDRW